MHNASAFSRSLFPEKLVDLWLSSEYASYPRGYEDVLKIVPAFDSFNATYSDFILVMVLKNCQPDFFITCLRKSCFLSVIPVSKIAEKTFVMPVFRTELSLMEFLLRFLAVLIHFSSFFRFFFCFEMGSLYKSMLLILVFRKAPFFFVFFPYYVLITFLMMLLVILSMLTMPPSTWNVICIMICCNSLSYAVVVSGLVLQIPSWIRWIRCRNGYLDLLVLHFSSKCGNCKPVIGTDLEDVFLNRFIIVIH